eukprot:5248181-Prymnesium_polylepis.1
MAATIGPSCSTDVEELSNAEYRAAVDNRVLHISGSSTAQQLANDSAYPLVARMSFAESETAVVLTQL